MKLGKSVFVAFGMISFGLILSASVASATECAVTFRKGTEEKTTVKLTINDAVGTRVGMVDQYVYNVQEEKQQISIAFFAGPKNEIVAGATGPANSDIPVSLFAPARGGNGVLAGLRCKTEAATK